MLPDMLTVQHPLKQLNHTCRKTESFRDMASAVFTDIVWTANVYLVIKLLPQIFIVGNTEGMQAINKTCAIQEVKINPHPVPSGF